MFYFICFKCIPNVDYVWACVGYVLLWIKERIFKEMYRQKERFHA